MSDPEKISMLVSLVVFLAAALFIKRKRWIILSIAVAFLILLPYLISLISFHFYFWYFILFLPGRSHPTLYAYLTLAPVWSSFGLIGGTLARVVIRYYKSATIKQAVITLPIAYVLVFCLGLGYEIAALRIHASVGNPLSAKCAKSELYFLLGNAAINVPATPAIILHTGSNRLWTIYASMFDWPMRELCKKAENQNNPMKITDISFAFPLMDGYLKERSFGFSRLICDADDKDASGKLLCEAATFKPLSKRKLFGIQIVPEKFSPNNFPAGAWHYRYEAFLEEKELAAKAGKPWTATKAGLFDRYPNGYYVAHDAALTDGGKNPITLHCDVSTPMGWFDCTTVRPLPGALQGIVSFSTPITELNQTAIAANQSAEKLLTLLSTPSQ